MKKPVIEIKTDEVEISDGYHTFTQLYDHRITLYIALCKQRNARKNEFAPNGNVWRSKKHSDGTSWDGWFILGICKLKGFQITYHLPIERWNETDFAETLEQAPEYDGHTPEDVLERLKTL
jgi:hypothetical protein